jgi:hypothetical protein
MQDKFAGFGALLPKAFAGRVRFCHSHLQKVYLMEINDSSMKFTFLLRRGIK